MPLWSLVRSREEFGGESLPLLTVVSESGVEIRDLSEGRAPSEDLSAYRTVRPGDLVVNKMWARFGAYGVSRHEGVISPAYWVLRVRRDVVYPAFLHYLLRSSPYRAEVWRRSKDLPPNGFNIPWDQFRTVRIALPPVGTQRAIADFLDAETARIDALIAKKRRMAELVDERLRSWTILAVLGDMEGTSGAGSRSGFFRIVPTGWSETALRHLGCEVQTGPFGSQLHAEDYVGDGWPVINPTNLVGGRIEASPEVTISDEKRSELARHILRRGDIVFGRRGELGRAGLVGEPHDGWLCGTGSLRLRLRERRLIPEYLKYFVETPVAKAYFKLASVGSTMDNLSTETVLALPVLVPPLHEQEAIVDAVLRREANAEALRTRLARETRLLSEHRQARISSAVTGRVEGPGTAA
jgi:type I restriction enzyme S subunit